VRHPHFEKQAVARRQKQKNSVNKSRVRKRPMGEARVYFAFSLAMIFSITSIIGRR
jgi:hypothetical protein